VIVSHIRPRGGIATLITNGYMLTLDRILRLNRAGLEHLQDQRRQRAAGRRVCEELESDGSEAAIARQMRRSSA
jgi:hypothetical protein